MSTKDKHAADVAAIRSRDYDLEEALLFAEAYQGLMANPNVLLITGDQPVLTHFRRYMKQFTARRHDPRVLPHDVDQELGKVALGIVAARRYPGRTAITFAELDAIEPEIAFDGLILGTKYVSPGQSSRVFHETVDGKEETSVFSFSMWFHGDNELHLSFESKCPPGKNKMCAEAEAAKKEFKTMLGRHPRFRDMRFPASAARDAPAPAAREFSGLQGGFFNHPAQAAAAAAPEFRPQGAENDVSYGVAAQVLGMLANYPNGGPELQIRVGDDSMVIIKTGRNRCITVAATAVKTERDPTKKSPRAVQVARRIINDLVIQKPEDVTVNRQPVGTDHPLGPAAMDELFRQTDNGGAAASPRPEDAPHSQVIWPAHIANASTADMEAALARSEAAAAPVPTTVPAATKVCRVCGKPSTKKCSVCMHAKYCSRACQQSDWKEHKLQCYGVE